VVVESRMIEGTGGGGDDEDGARVCVEADHSSRAILSGGSEPALGGEVSLLSSRPRVAISLDSTQDQVRTHSHPIFSPKKACIVVAGEEHECMHAMHTSFHLGRVEYLASSRASFTL